MRLVEKYQPGSAIEKALTQTKVKKSTPAEMAQRKKTSKKKETKTPYKVTKDTKNGVTRTTEEGGHPDSNTYLDPSFFEQFSNLAGDSIVSALYPAGLGNGIIIEGDPNIYKILGDRYYGRR